MVAIRTRKTTAPETTETRAKGRAKTTAPETVTGPAPKRAKTTETAPVKIVTGGAVRAARAPKTAPAPETTAPKTRAARAKTTETAPKTTGAKGRAKTAPETTAPKTRAARYDPNIVRKGNVISRPVDPSAKDSARWETVAGDWNAFAFHYTIFSRGGTKVADMKSPKGRPYGAVSFPGPISAKAYGDAWVSANGGPAKVAGLNVSMSIYRNHTLVGKWNGGQWTVDPTAKLTKAAPAPSPAPKTTGAKTTAPKRAPKTETAPAPSPAPKRAPAKAAPKTTAPAKAAPAPKTAPKRAAK